MNVEKYFDIRLILTLYQVQWLKKLKKKNLKKGYLDYQNNNLKAGKRYTKKFIKFLLLLKDVTMYLNLTIN